ncbi:MAG: polymorphic toxin-type HINT domain-containing protein [bacterium]
MNLKLRKTILEEETTEEAQKASVLSIKYVYLLGILLVIFLGIWWTLARINVKSEGVTRISLEANGADLNGIKKETTFVLRTNKAETPAVLEKNLKFTPTLDFKIKRNNSQSIFAPINFLSAATGDNLYEIIPKQPLIEGVNYQIETATSGEIKFDHDYSWAFKVKDEFNTKETVPGDKVSGVPLETGIEVAFNRLDVAADIADYFSIEPVVKGKFLVASDKITFIPEKSLQKKTLYKVTIKKGYKSGEKAEQLEKDKIFTFETVADDKSVNTPDLSFNTDFSEMTTEKPGYFEASGNATSAKMFVYKYDSLDNFLLDYYKNYDRYNAWSVYNKGDFELSEAAKPVFNFRPELLKQGEFNNYGLIQLPKKLDVGLYAFKILVNGQAQFSFSRVSPLAYYYSVVNGDGLIWTYDFINKKPLNGIKVYFKDQAGQERLLGETDKDGLVKFDASTDKAIDAKVSLVFRGAGISETGVPNIGNMTEKRVNYFQGYLNTDRYAYRLSDKINFWGVIKGRSVDLKQKKVKVSLDGLVEKEVLVSSFDTIQGDLEFQGLPSGYHSLTVSYNDEQITTAGIESFAFEKPLYKIEVTSDKNYAVTGDTVKAKVKVNFFDGTPVKGMALAYVINWQDEKSGQVVTNELGEASLSYKPEYYFRESSDLYTDSWTNYPQALRFNVRPAMSEEGDIWGEVYVNVYGPQLNMQSDAKEMANKIIFTAKVNELNFASKNENEMLGQAVADQKIKAQIYKYFYEQIADGDYYDPLEKIKIKKYRYETRKTLLKEVEGITDQAGEYNLEIDKQEIGENGYLKALFLSEDKDGKKIKSNATSYDYFYQNSNSSLNLTNQDVELKKLTEYNQGDEINLKTKLLGIQKPLDDLVLIMRYQDGLKGTSVITGDNYKDLFVKEYIPAITYKAVKAMPSGFIESESVTASFNQESKKLDISIKTDKVKYRPRDEVKLAIKITDQSKKGVNAIANVATVDEALFNITPWGYGGFILDSLYADIVAYPYSISTRYVTSFTNGAEKGGCFLAGTSIKVANGQNKNIEDIRVGDEIVTLADDNSSTKVMAVVQGVSSHDVDGYLLINNKLKLTPEHVVYLNNKWQAIGKAKIGDFLRLDNLKSQTITEMKYVMVKKIKVYNIIVGKYHTYFADGFYVHNAEKGGGGDNRNFFADVPLYKEFQSDDEGNINTSFVAPDNLTGWRVSVNAYNQAQFQAGNNSIIVPVGLPLFVDAVLSKTYLSGDSPFIKIRAFGDKYREKQPVTFSVKSEALGLDFSTTTTASELSLPLSVLKSGNFKISISVKQSGMSDTLERNFAVVDNYMQQNVVSRKPVTDGVAGIQGSGNGFTDLIFTDSGRGQYYSQLLDLVYQNSLRSDIGAASYIATLLFNENYSSSRWQINDSFSLQDYQNNQLISLFPYSSPSLSVTALLTDAMPDKIDSQSIISQLETLVGSNSSSTVEELAQASYALASLGRANLPMINYLAKNSQTSFKAKIYLALALEKAGDREAARAIYENELEPKLQVNDIKELYFNVDTNPAEKIKMTALIGILAVRLGDQENLSRAGMILNYLKNNLPVDDTTALEQAMILRILINKIPSQSAEFKFSTNSRKGVVNLANGADNYLSLSVAELKSLTFSDVKGMPEVLSFYEVDRDQGGSEKRSSDLSVSQTYLVDGKVTKTFKDGDLVQVRLDPRFEKGAPDDNYQLVDYLPSNLKPIIQDYNPNLPTSTECDTTWYPVKKTDSAVYFNVGKWFSKNSNCAHRTINYHVRVTGKGEFRDQGAILQSLKNLNIQNFADEFKVLVK